MAVKAAVTLQREFIFHTPSSQTSAAALSARPPLQTSLGEVGIRFGWCPHPSVCSVSPAAALPIHPSIPSLPPIPLILFPVPLALRSYLRSSALAIRLSPSPSPSLSLWRAPLPSPCLGSPPCADTLARARTHTLPERARERRKKLVSHARTYYSSLLLLPSSPSPSPSRLGGAVSFTPRTVQESGGGGVGYIPPGVGHELHSDWNSLAVRKDHKQEDSEAGSRSTNIHSGAFWREEETQTPCLSDSAGLSAWKLRQQPIGPSAPATFQPSPGPSGKQPKLVVNSLELVRVSLCL